MTHATEDDALFALYDVNYDLNRAVEKLLENSDIQVSVVCVYPHFTWYILGSLLCLELCENK